ncbi:MAG: hypothetical protein C0602_01645 [Denitrovibrio sp.]|nr:MAG: hypothetical protein C0602_01645 [Denitrovibrio sp.]
MEKCSTEKLLKNTKTKMTSARSSLLNIILENSSPETATSLHKKLSKETRIDLATVYRTLKIFNQKGLIRAINLDGEKIYYEKSCEHNPLHAHFYCEKCGDVECLNPFGFDESTSFVKMADKKEINSVELILRGRCEKCS